jgi:hypothetical protein
LVLKENLTGLAFGAIRAACRPHNLLIVWMMMPLSRTVTRAFAVFSPFSLKRAMRLHNIIRLPLFRRLAGIDERGRLIVDRTAVAFTGLLEAEGVEHLDFVEAADIDAAVAASLSFTLGGMSGVLNSTWSCISPKLCFVATSPPRTCIPPSSTSFQVGGWSETAPYPVRFQVVFLTGKEGDLLCVAEASCFPPEAGRANRAKALSATIGAANEIAKRAASVQNSLLSWHVSRAPFRETRENFLPAQTRIFAREEATRVTDNLSACRLSEGKGDTIMMDPGYRHAKSGHARCRPFSHPLQADYGSGRVQRGQYDRVAYGNAENRAVTSDPGQRRVDIAA